MANLSFTSLPGFFYKCKYYYMLLQIIIFLIDATITYYIFSLMNHFFLLLCFWFFQSHSKLELHSMSCSTTRKQANERAFVTTRSLVL